MDCRQSQALVALTVGQDHADARAEQALQQHLRDCSACQQFHRELIAAQQALSESRLHPSPRRPLWPRVAERLAELERHPQFARFNVWVPSAVAAAACLLLVSVAMLEVGRREGPLLPGVVWDRPTTRDLFRSDPEFNSLHGQLPSLGDLERWKKRHGQRETPAFPDSDLQHHAAW